MNHSLKTWHEYFQAVLDDKKTFEIRKNDRDFSVGDFLRLEEFNPDTESYTGRSIHVRVLYILDKQPFVPDGYVCMSIRKYFAK